jgi:16S rRNA (guanine527-N7)-methyltransferase
MTVHLRLLDAWNPFINLTRIEHASERASRHLFDALVAVPLIDQLLPSGGTFADLGSGGGFPGAPLAARLLATRPEATFDLIEATGKKARFLDAVVAASGLAPRLRVVHARAEDLVSQATTRYDVIAARAVAPLAELTRIARPLLAAGGHLVAWKRDGDGWSEELATATSLVGGDAIRVHRVTQRGLDRALLVLVSG